MSVSAHPDYRHGGALTVQPETADVTQLTSPGDVVPRGLWLGPRAVSPGAVIVYLAITRHTAVQPGMRRPPRSVLAADSGLTRRTVDAKLTELVGNGWIPPRSTRGDDAPWRGVLRNTRKGARTEAEFLADGSAL